MAIYYPRPTAQDPKHLFWLEPCSNGKGKYYIYEWTHSYSYSDRVNPIVTRLWKYRRLMDIYATHFHCAGEGFGEGRVACKRIHPSNGHKHCPNRMYGKRLPPIACDRWQCHVECVPGKQLLYEGDGAIFRRRRA